MQSVCLEQLPHGGSASAFTIAVGPWPTMIAHLLLAVTGSDAETRLGDDLARARRLATLVGEGPEVNAALSRTLIEPPAGQETLPFVELELASWGCMRARLLLEAVGVAGSPAGAAVLLGLSRQQLYREVCRARWQDWRGAAR